MKYIDFVSPTDVLDPFSDKVVRKMSQREVLIYLTLAPEFRGDKVGHEATELISGTQRSIRKQEKQASESGHWSFEDSQGRALKNAAEKFVPQPELADAAHDHLTAVVQQKSELPGSAARPVESPQANGASVAAS